MHAVHSVSRIRRMCYPAVACGSILTTFLILASCNPPSSTSGAPPGSIRLLNLGPVQSFNQARLSSDGNVLLLTTVSVLQPDSSHKLSMQLTKTDLNGSVLWNKIYSDTVDLLAADFVEKPDGGILIVGTQSLLANSTKVAVVVVGSDGQRQKYKVYADTTSTTPNCTGALIYPMHDGNYIACGTTTDPHPHLPGHNDGTRQDAYLLALSPSGDSLRLFSYIVEDYSIKPSGILPTDDGGLVLLCGVVNLKVSEPYFIKIGPNDDVSPQVGWGESNAISIHAFLGHPIGTDTTQSRYILIGDSTHAAGSRQAVIYGVDGGPTYLALWKEAFSPGISNGFMAGCSTADSGYLACGYTGSAAGTSVLLNKFAKDNKLEWTKTYPGAGADTALSAMQTQDGGYVIAGVTTSFGVIVGAQELFVMRLNAQGNYRN